MAGLVADAILKDWTFVPSATDSSFRVSGAIYADTKGRFRDGERVTTSRVTGAQDDCIQTRNTLYRLVGGPQC